MFDFSWWRTTTGVKQQPWHESWERRPPKAGKRTMWLLWSEPESSTLPHRCLSKTSKPTTTVRPRRCLGPCPHQQLPLLSELEKSLRRTEWDCSIFILLACRTNCVMYELFAVESDDCSLALGAVFWSWGNGGLKELAQNPRECRPVYLYNSGVFCMVKFSAYENENKNMIMNISGHVLLFLCFLVQNMPSSGFSVAHV